MNARAGPWLTAGVFPPVGLAIPRPAQGTYGARATPTFEIASPYESKERPPGRKLRSGSSRWCGGSRWSRSAAHALQCRAQVTPRPPPPPPSPVPKELMKPLKTRRNCSCSVQGDKKRSGEPLAAGPVHPARPPNAAPAARPGSRQSHTGGGKAASAAGGALQPPPLYMRGPARRPSVAV
jgi:hypothetical protein